jgi:hypothetical protein
MRATRIRTRVKLIAGCLFVKVGLFPVSLLSIISKSGDHWRMNTPVDGEK